MGKYLNMVREKVSYEQGTYLEKPENSNNLVFRGGNLARIEAESAKPNEDQHALAGAPPGSENEVGGNTVTFVAKPKSGQPAAISRQAFKERGLEVLPEDHGFLLRYLPAGRERCNAIVQEYERVWLEAMTKEAGGHRKQNRGRLVANTWLRVESPAWRR